MMARQLQDEYHDICFNITSAPEFNIRQHVPISSWSLCVAGVAFALITCKHLQYSGSRRHWGISAENEVSIKILSKDAKHENMKSMSCGWLDAPTQSKVGGRDYGIFTRGSEVNPLLLTLYEVPRRPCLAGCSRTRALIPQKLPRILTFAPGDGTAEENTNIFVIETNLNWGYFPKFYFLSSLLI